MIVDERSEWMSVKSGDWITAFAGMGKWGGRVLNSTLVPATFWRRPESRKTLDPNSPQLFVLAFVQFKLYMI
jgi:hypothetical protein